MLSGRALKVEPILVAGDERYPVPILVAARVDGARHRIARGYARAGAGVSGDLAVGQVLCADLERAPVHRKAERRQEIRTRRGGGVRELRVEPAPPIVIEVDEVSGAVEQEQERVGESAFPRAGALQLEAVLVPGDERNPIPILIA